MDRTTPAAFRTTITEPTVPMVPLVRDATRNWRSGWCTYPDGFENNPDIEVFCGGENEKTERAAALWRQGNLFHFGFEQSPAEMNENGQRLLLNAIAYISRFTEDRPIAVTPSVFAGPVSYPRTYLDRRLGENGDVGDASWMLDAALVEKLKPRSPENVQSWYAAHRAYLHPSPAHLLIVDEEALALRAPIDTLELFTQSIAALDAADEVAARARLLLDRYRPETCKLNGQSSQAEWSAWLDENRPYLFFSDQGDYRWYVDPLARKRGVPSAQLRGPARASRP